MLGIRFSVAKCTVCSPCGRVRRSPMRRSASGCSRAIPAKMRSKSDGPLTSRDCSLIPNTRAASCTSLQEPAFPGLAAFHTTATRDVRDRLHEQLQSFGGCVGSLLRRASEVPAGPGEAGDQPCAHGIKRVRLNDWNRLGRVFDGANGRCRGDYDHVGVESNQLGGKLGKPLRPFLRVSPLHDEILSLDVPEFPELLKEDALDPC